MRGISRESFAAAQDRLEALLRAPSTDLSALSSDLFGITGVLAGSAGLRRALTDPARSGEAKAEMITRLLDGKVGGDALDLVAGLARARWGAAGDLTDAVESLGVEAALAQAERNGRLESVEDELFRFARTISGDVGLRDAFSSRTEGAERKRQLVSTLLGRQVGPESLALAEQAAAAPRGLRTERVLERFVAAAAVRRQQLVAEVVSAVPLGTTERDRLTAALQRIYGRAIQIHADVDPAVTGGLRVQVGGETVDGTIASRVDDARRRLAG
jgi:F-type H+-transporting ATPase subunit delta